MRYPRHSSAAAGAFLAVLFCVAASFAYASWVPRTSADVASVKRFCSAASTQTGIVVGLQCQSNVRILSGAKLTDGGTRATSDAGAPITPGNSDELVAFPGDTYPVALGTGERCLGVVSADAGTNNCTFFDSTAP